MKYWYDVITSESVDIDFQEIFDFIKKEEPQCTELCDIYLEFVDNIGYYIRSVYSSAEDLVDSDNDYFLQTVQEGWEKFLEEKFKYK